jgi:polysaccharide biosynthesis/export protein
MRIGRTERRRQKWSFRQIRHDAYKEFAEEYTMRSAFQFWFLVLCLAGCVAPHDRAARLSQPATRLIQDTNSTPFVILTGHVHSPGIYAYAAGLTVGQLVEAADGFTASAIEKLYVVRNEETLAVDDTATLQQGDILCVQGVVPPQVYVLGYVEKPGAYPLADGLTARTAIEAAGGAVPGHRRHGLLIRGEGHERKEMKFELTNAGSVQLRDGDRIVVGVTQVLPRSTWDLPAF